MENKHPHGDGDLPEAPERKDGKVNRTGIHKRDLKRMTHDHLVTLHEAISEELADRAKDHKSKSPDRMSDHDFEKWRDEEIAKGEDSKRHDHAD
jgi:ketosteroid isomerase-like protein